MKKITFILLIIITLSACSTQSDKWTGFHYPEGAPQQGEAIFEAQEFETKETCEEWANEQAKENEKAEHFCGFRCHYDNSGQYACSSKTIQ